MEHETKCRLKLKKTKKGGPTLAFKKIQSGFFGCCTLSDALACSWKKDLMLNGFGAHRHKSGCAFGARKSVRVHGRHEPDSRTIVKANKMRLSERGNFKEKYSIINFTSKINKNLLSLTPINKI